MIFGVVQGVNLVLVSVFGFFWVIFNTYVAVKEFSNK
jgi:nitrogen fixation protein FixH